MSYFRFYVKELGGHTHVTVRGGTKTQFDNKTLPKLGNLIMSNDDWFTLERMLEIGSVTFLHGPRLTTNIDIVKQEDDD